LTDCELVLSANCPVSESKITRSYCKTLVANSWPHHWMGSLLVDVVDAITAQIILASP